jgi:hypothetical protein
MYDMDIGDYKKQGISSHGLISRDPFSTLQIPIAVISFPAGRIFSSSNNATFLKKVAQ